MKLNIVPNAIIAIGGGGSNEKDIAYFSTQSQSSSEVSSGVMSSNMQHTAACGGNLPMINKSSLAKKGASRLFKGVQICPPIAPKTMMSPNLQTKKVSRDASKSG